MSSGRHAAIHAAWSAEPNLSVRIAKTSASQASRQVPEEQRKGPQGPNRPGRSVRLTPFPKHDRTERQAGRPRTKPDMWLARKRF